MIPAGIVRGAAAAGACVAAAVAVAGCAGSGSSSGTGSATTGGGPSTQTTTTTATTTVTTSPSTSSATAAGASSSSAPAAAAASAGCGAAQIEVVVGPSQAGLGHVGFVLLFHNSGPAACTLTGYPGVALVRRGGAELNVPRSPNGYLGGLAPSDKVNPVVRIPHDGSASALLEGEDFDNAAQKPCPRYAALLVTPPNQTVTRRLADTVTICKPTIHPVVAGTTGRQR